jgi:hypothetical protein
MASSPHSAYARFLVFSARTGLIGKGSKGSRLFSNSGPGVKLLFNHPCRVQGSLRGRGMPSA